MPNYGKHGKTHYTIGILLLLGITILAIAVTLSPNNAIGQEQTLHDMTVYEARSQTVGSGEKAEIAAGDSPSAILGVGSEESLYVAYGNWFTGSNSRTISVISIPNSTRSKIFLLE